MEMNHGAFGRMAGSRRQLLQMGGLGAAAAIGLAKADRTGAWQTGSTVTSHPRIWITAENLPRLQGWATDDNPFWSGGLLPLAEELAAAADGGVILAEDDGGVAWNQYPTENAAELFAFISMVHPDAEERNAYGERAKALLMYAIGEAAKGVAEGEPFRDPYFPIFDRSRWWGEAFPITVDWIYDRLTADDKAMIREVFVGWCEVLTTAETTTMNHPEPVGVVHDPVLLEDPIRLRWAGNNYFTAHMRNLGLMALALDPDDDPDGALTGHLEPAIGAWLYMADALLQGDARGGLAAEGFEYSQQALAYVVQFLLALETSGNADPKRWGPHVVLANNPFWDDVVPGFLNSLSPVPTVISEADWLGPVYQPAWYGDGEAYWSPDFIALFSVMGQLDVRSGNTERLDALRWIETHMAPGGEEMLLYRTSSIESALTAISYFLLFDPDAPAPQDPRSATPTEHVSEGLGRVLARTSWDEDARWFTWGLGWNTVDHQHSEGNGFEFYRRGEWLTKERTGYGFAIGCSDFHNTLAIQNTPLDIDPEDYRGVISAHGSQWMIVAEGDPEILGLSVTGDYVFASGDATRLYNSAEQAALDVIHASRSIFWLKPDVIVVYDRAETGSEGRFKQFWLNMPTEPVIDGSVATMTTDAGQHLIVTTVLPADAGISAESADTEETETERAVGEPMHFRLRVEAQGGPASARFLHVLQGADAEGAVFDVEKVASEDGAMIGATVGEWSVLFAVDLSAGEPEVMTYSVSSGVMRHLVSGLPPGAGYAIERTDGDGRVTIEILRGGEFVADEGGVLAFSLKR